MDIHDPQPGPDMPSWHAACLSCGMMTTWSLTDLSERLLDLIAPLTCPLCGMPLDQGCACRVCSIPDPALPIRQLRCDGRGEFLLLGGGPFRDGLRGLVHACKYGQDPAALRLLVAQALLPLPRELPWDALVSVPAHPVRARERGWEPVGELAAGLAQACRIPLCPLLRRVRYTPPLTGRRGIERRRLVRGAFAAAPAAGCLLVVDDVSTSGATFRDCRRALLDAGARSVDLLVAAITPRFPEYGSRRAERLLSSRACASVPAVQSQYQEQSCRSCAK